MQADLPSISVEDMDSSNQQQQQQQQQTQQQQEYQQSNNPQVSSSACNGSATTTSNLTGNNLEIFKRLNALMDNSLDLTSLGVGNQQQQQPMQQPQQQHMPGISVRTDLNKNGVLANIPTNPDLFHINSGALPDPYAQFLQDAAGNNSPLMTPTLPSSGPITPTNSNVNTPLANRQAMTQQLIDQNFITGAISNRTLEQLTESMNRQGRPVRGVDNKYGSERNLLEKLNTEKLTALYQQQQQQQQQTNPGIIGEKNYLAPGQTDTGMWNSRSPSPSDSSDTSGFGSECSSESALVDLMSSLNLLPAPNNSQQAHLNSQALAASQAAAFYNNQQTHNNAALNSQQLLQSQQQSSLQNLVSPLGSQVGILRALGLQSPSVHSTAQQRAVSPTTDAELMMGGEQFYDKHWSSLNSLFQTANSDPYSIERAAKLYRNAASICEATCTWSGQFPPRLYKNPIYSPKVFLGGVPWDITEAGLQASFRSFGPMKIEWPGKDGKHPRYPTKAGYVYVLFEAEKSVKTLLQSCTQDFSNGGEYYFKISSRRMRSKEVQVIPWVLSDSNFVRQSSDRLDPNKTVFVGALHGMMNAEGLAHIMNDLFGNVVYAGIDTDKHKYPIGSGRVTFNTHKSYMKAVNAAFVEVKAAKFTKKLQIDPYLEDSLCGSCCMNQGPFFCRDLTCFRYYCRTCWQWAHSMEHTRHHKPLMRNSRQGQGQSQSSVDSVQGVLDGLSAQLSQAGSTGGSTTNLSYPTSQTQTSQTSTNAAATANLASVLQQQHAASLAAAQQQQQLQQTLFNLTQ